MLTGFCAHDVRGDCLPNQLWRSSSILHGGGYVSQRGISAWPVSMSASWPMVSIFLVALGQGWSLTVWGVIKVGSMLSNLHGVKDVWRIIGTILIYLKDLDEALKNVRV